MTDGTGRASVPLNLTRGALASAGFPWRMEQQSG